MKRLLREWKHYLAEEEKMSSEQEEINVSAQQIENLLDGYVDQEDIQKVYDFVRYFYAKRKIKELNAAYQRLEGESLADSINGITGLENYKKQILKYLGGKFEATILDKISYFFGRKENAGIVEPLRSPDAYLHWDGDQLHYKVGGKIIRSWDGTSGKLWFLPAGWRDQKEQSFGPIPEGRYATGTVQDVYRNVQDPGTLDEIIYLVKDIVGKPTQHDFSTSGGPSAVYSQIAWGNHRVPIIGGALGRGSFYIHGGTLRGSSGCIDLDAGMEHFAKFWTMNSLFKKEDAKGEGEYICPTLVVDYQGKIEPEDTKSDAIARMKKTNITS